MGWAVDLAKAEFQGKTALAASKGSAKQTVVSIAFPEGAEGLDGTEITVKGRVAGVVSMAIPSPALGGKMLALGRIDTAHSSEGTVVSVADSIGTVVSMPVNDPDRKRTRG